MSGLDGRVYTPNRGDRETASVENASSGPNREPRSQNVKRMVSERETVVERPWAADSCPCVVEAAFVFPVTVGIKRQCGAVGVHLRWRRATVGCAQGGSIESRWSGRGLLRRGCGTLLRELAEEGSSLVWLRVAALGGRLLSAHAESPSLVKVPPTVSTSPSRSLCLPLCLPHLLAHCVSHCVFLTLGRGAAGPAAGGAERPQGPAGLHGGAGGAGRAAGAGRGGAGDT